MQIVKKALEGARLEKFLQSPHTIQELSNQDITYRWHNEMKDIHIFQNCVNVYWMTYNPMDMKYTTTKTINIEQIKQDNAYLVGKN